MKNAIFYITALIIFTTFSNCKVVDDDTPIIQNTFYDFNLGIKMFDTKSEYQVNDVITLEINIPNKRMNEVQGGNSITIGNATFGLDLDINTFFPFTTNTPVFELIPEEGMVTQDGIFPEFGSASFSYGCPASDYKLRFGIRFKQAGNFLIQLHKNGTDEQIVFTDDSDCALQDVFPPPAEASIGSVIYFFDINDVNQSVYDTYINETPEALDEDIAPFITALNNKLGYFVKVN